MEKPASSARRKKKRANEEAGKPGPRIKLTLRIMLGDNIALGPGKADLLEAIANTGSISAAGRSMDMSYRRAWLLVDEMNRCFKTPLVTAAKGGVHGGGAQLTDEGRQVLEHYRTMAGATKQLATAYLNLFHDFLAEAPMAPAQPPAASEESA